MKKLMCLLLVVMMLAFAGCASEQGESAGSVNGVDISMAEYEYYLTDYYNYYYENYYAYFQTYMGVDLLDEESASSTLGDLETYAWDVVVEAELLRQIAADDYGITVEDTFLKDFISDVSYKTMQINTMYAQLVEKIREELQAALVVEDADIQAAYDADPTSWDGVLTSHILIACDVSDEEAKAEAYQRALEVIELLNGGADFAETAIEYSDDGSAASGGEISAYINALGYEVGSTESSYFTEYTTAAWNLQEIGDYSQEPVESSAGYHIILLRDKRIGFDASKDTIAASLQVVSDEDLSAAITEKIAAKKEASEIVRNVEYKYYVEPVEEEVVPEESAEGTDDAAAEEGSEEAAE
ncbi:MAG: peptidylprolyl isomerase [Bacillota bacterium]|nr:peptidylprolyl isomerase [Bacillota bacterium]